MNVVRATFHAIVAACVTVVNYILCRDQLNLMQERVAALERYAASLDTAPTPTSLTPDDSQHAADGTDTLPLEAAA